jgi:hypothetical protein
VGGPDLVGGFTLLRVLPGIVGVLAAAGLPGAAPYYLSSRPTDRTLRPTLVAMTVTGATIGALGWLVFSPLLHIAFFSTWSLALTAAASAFTNCPWPPGSRVAGSGDPRSQRRDRRRGSVPPVY